MKKDSKIIQSIYVLDTNAGKKLIEVVQSIKSDCKQNESQLNYFIPSIKATEICIIR